MFKIGKLKIHPSFFFFLIIIIALGYLKQFFLLVAVTTIHELSHVLVARSLGLHTENITITPIGEIARIDGLEGIPAFKRCVIILAGPGINIALAFLLMVLKDKSGAMELNAAIAFFNLLPIYPFDGGRLLYVVLGNRIGVLKSRAFICAATKIGIGLLCIAGFIQTALYPFNISLAAIAAFLITIYRKEKEAMLFSYYSCMLNKHKRICQGLKMKTAVFSSEAAPFTMQRVFTWDYYHVIYIVEDGEIIDILTEKQVFEQWG